jgi:hypothetical protein
VNILSFNILVRFQVLTAESMKIAFWNSVQASVVEVDQSFGVSYYFQRPVNGAISISKTSVNFCKTTRSSVPEICNLCSVLAQY